VSDDETARAVAAEIRKAGRRCRHLSDDLVQTWNRITSIRTELAHHRIEPERHVTLTARLQELHAEQDRLEADMTKAAQRWVALTARDEASFSRRPATAMLERRQTNLFETVSA
jgi:predicted  nucleic acid-binding Zn-ribbon protein